MIIARHFNYSQTRMCTKAHACVCAHMCVRTHVCARPLACAPTHKHEHSHHPDSRTDTSGDGKARSDQVELGRRTFSCHHSSERVRAHTRDFCVCVRARAHAGGCASPACKVCISCLEAKKVAPAHARTRSAAQRRTLTCHVARNDATDRCTV